MLIKKKVYSQGFINSLFCIYRSPIKANYDFMSYETGQVENTPIDKQLTFSLIPGSRYQEIPVCVLPYIIYNASEEDNESFVLDYKINLEEYNHIKEEVYGDAFFRKWGEENFNSTSDNIRGDINKVIQTIKDPSETVKYKTLPGLLMDENYNILMQHSIIMDMELFKIIDFTININPAVMINNEKLFRSIRNRVIPAYAQEEVRSVIYFKNMRKKGIYKYFNHSESTDNTVLKNLIENGNGVLKRMYRTDMDRENGNFRAKAKLIISDEFLVHIRTKNPMPLEVQENLDERANNLLKSISGRPDLIFNL